MRAPASLKICLTAPGNGRGGRWSRNTLPGRRRIGQGDVVRPTKQITYTCAVLDEEVCAEPVATAAALFGASDLALGRSQMRARCT